MEIKQVKRILEISQEIIQLAEEKDWKEEEFLEAISLVVSKTNNSLSSFVAARTMLQGGGTVANLPIDPDILHKRKMIPIKLAELSYTKPDVALDLLRVWGEKQKPITPLFDEILSHFETTKGA